MISVVIVTHGLFGQELLRTAEDIVGRQEKVMALSITAQSSRDLLGSAVEESIERLGTESGILFLVDMLGGTPCNVVLLRAKGRPCEVVTGVNLYMVISAFTHRSELSLTELAKKVSEDAKRAIVLPQMLLKGKS